MSVRILTPVGIHMIPVGINMIRTLETQVLMHCSHLQGFSFATGLASWVNIVPVGQCKQFGQLDQSCSCGAVLANYPPSHIGGSSFLICDHLSRSFCTPLTRLGWNNLQGRNF